jgi:hypothetical protein
MPYFAEKNLCVTKGAGIAGATFKFGPTPPGSASKASSSSRNRLDLVMRSAKALAIVEIE